MIVAENDLTYSQARGVEQRLIDKFGGIDQLLNKINGVGANNPNRQIYFDAADEIMHIIFSKIPTS